MSFQKYTSTLDVEAEQIEGEPRSVITPTGNVTAYPGQWEVRYPDGNVQVVEDDDFQDTFGEGSDDDSSQYNETASDEKAGSPSQESSSSSPAGKETATEGSMSTTTKAAKPGKDSAK